MFQNIQLIILIRFEKGPFEGVTYVLENDVVEDRIECHHCVRVGCDSKIVFIFFFLIVDRAVDVLSISCAVRQK